jgi:hypothetical protein
MAAVGESGTENLEIFFVRDDVMPFFPDMAANRPRSTIPERSRFSSAALPQVAE